MIILLGPDGTGKTTLAKKLEQYGLKYIHYTKDSNYLDYITPLCNLSLANTVLDRHALCEYPYSICMNRPFKFTIKQWHNIITMTLIQKPVIVLCSHKPPISDYSADQYLPYMQWDKCLLLYKSFLNTHHITYTEYDYSQSVSSFVDNLLTLNTQFNEDIAWWRTHWTAKYGCAGSSHPKFLLVAERIGPNNLHNIPFETGPTGLMLSNMLMATGTPLGNLAITNMVKSFRRDARQVNDHDVQLLEEELIHLHPNKVIFMGSIAKKGISLAKSYGCEVGTLVHLGSLNYKGIKDMTGYYNEWKKLLGLVPTVSFQ